MPIGALAGGLGLLGSLAGIPAARRARRETEGRFNQALGLQREQLEQNQAFRALGLQQQQRALGDIRAGYDDALRSVETVGAESRRAIADQTALGVSAARASAMNRGLSNTTAGRGLETQARYQGQRAQGSLAERLAAMRANLYAGRGSALAGARRGVAGSFEGLARGGAADTQGLINVLGSRVDTFDGGIGANLGQAGVLLGHLLQGGGK